MADQTVVVEMIESPDLAAETKAKKGKAKAAPAKAAVPGLNVNVAREGLGVVLGIMNRAISARSTLPVLSNVLLTAKGQRLVLTTTDLEWSISCTIEAVVVREGAVTVPVGLFEKLVKTMAGDMVTLLGDEAEIKIKSAKFSSTLKGLPAEDFPLIPQIDAPVTFEIMPTVLRQAIGQVVVAAAEKQDATRPAMSGVLLRKEGARLTLAATNGHRLAVRQIKLGEEANDVAVAAILRAGVLRDIASIIDAADLEKAVKITLVNDKPAVLEFTGKDAFELIRITVMQINAVYPDYERIIPTESSVRVVVDVALLQRALRGAGLFAVDASDRVTFTMTPGATEAEGQLLVQARSAERGDNRTMLDAVVVSAGVFRQAYNVSYLLAGLSAINTPTVTWETANATRPGLFRPDTDNPDYLYLVMPMELAAGASS